MQAKDYITVGISLVALLFSLSSLIVTFLNFKRNATKLNIEQLFFAPNPLVPTATPNKLFLDREQSQEFWTVVPMLHLIIYLKIDNLSHTGVSISNFIVNDEFLVSKVNTGNMKGELSLIFFASEKCNNREMEEYGHSIPMSATSLEPNDYNLINVGDRIDSKSSIEGIIIVSGNWNLYKAINDGDNKLTIVTPDKKIDTYIEVDKTIIPDIPKNE